MHEPSANGTEFSLAAGDPQQTSVTRHGQKENRPQSASARRQPKPKSGGRIRKLK
jgi:hypothetical protein